MLSRRWLENIPRASSFSNEPIHCLSSHLYKATKILRWHYRSAVHAFDVLGDPVRRRILELLADGERSAGDVTDVVRREFGITQPAVSQHLKVLRENGFTHVRAEGTRRLYSVDAAPLQETDAWLDKFRHFWTPHLNALATELARGKRERRLQAEREQAVPDASDSVGPESYGG